MKEELYRKTADYFKKVNGFDKVLLNDSIIDLNTNLLITKIINLGRDLFDILNIDMKNKFFDYLRNDILAQDIQHFDYTNELIIENTIEKWSENCTISPYDKEKINLYQFASISIRIYLMMKTYNFISNRMNSYKDYVCYDINDKNTLNRNKYFYIFNDYFLEELSENDRNKIPFGTLNFNYNISYAKIKEYLFRLYNDVNKVYKLVQFSSKIQFSKEEKQGKIFTYHETPISAVYKKLGEIFCSNNGRIIQCVHCGYYLEVENANTQYHRECYEEHERLRKKNKNDRN